MNQDTKSKDLQIWDDIFSNPPMDWKAFEPTQHMNDCIEFFKSRGVKSVLDLGCGPGRWSMTFARDGFSVSGIDFSQPAIDYASTWANEEGLEAQFMRAPVTRIPFNELFDAALASQILENLSASECTKAIDCLYACLKPKGVLFALFNPYMTPEQLVTIKSSDNPTKEATFVNYTDEELLGLFQENFVLLDQKNYSDGTRLLRLRARATD